MAGGNLRTKFTNRTKLTDEVNAAARYDHCAAVETRHFQRHKPGRQKSHWHNSAESYCLVGDAAGKAMVELLEK